CRAYRGVSAVRRAAGQLRNRAGRPRQNAGSAAAAFLAAADARTAPTRRSPLRRAARPTHRPGAADRPPPGAGAAVADRGDLRTARSAVRGSREVPGLDPGG